MTTCEKRGHDWDSESADTCLRCGVTRWQLQTARLENLERLLNNWLAWYEMGGGRLGALKSETEEALLWEGE